MTRKNIVAVAALLLLLPATIMAQTKKSFTLDDLMWGGSNYWNIMPKNHYTAWWGTRLQELGAEVVSVLTDDNGKKVYPKPQFTEADVNAALDTATMDRVHGVLSATFPDAVKPLALLRTKKVNILYDWKRKQVVWTAPTASGVSARDFCYASRSEAYVKDWNLYVTTADGQTHRISTDGTRELQYGLTVHRDEFGISKGTYWSPDGKRLAFYRMDQSMVTDYPLVDIAHRVAQLAPEKYPMAGMTSHQVTVGIYDAATGKTVYLQAGDPTDRYFTNIAWAPDSKTVYMFELPRTQDKAELVAYDAATGARKGVIYTETNARYVEPQHPIVFLPWNSGQFIMQSRRDGWNHIYLFSVNGKELAQLTKGEFEVTDVLGFNEKTKSVIYRSYDASPVRYNPNSVTARDGRRTL